MLRGTAQALEASLGLKEPLDSLLFLGKFPKVEFGPRLPNRLSK